MIWFIAVGAVWAFANLPRDGGALKFFLHRAGFPWIFAFWEGDHLTWFDATALAADVALGFSVASGLFAAAKVNTVARFISTKTELSVLASR